MALFISPKPYFFKIILDHTLIHGKLELPKKFVDKNGGGDLTLLKTATLRFPCGARWEVQLEKSCGKVSFTRGWPELAKFYSINVGYFIVFKFHGNWCFDVVILDFSATEIDYPMKSPVLKRKDNNQCSASDLILKIESDDDEKPAGSLPKMKKKKKKRLSKPRRIDDDDEEENLEMDCSKRQGINVRGSGSNHGDHDDRSSSESMRPMNPPRTPQPLTKNQEQVLRMASCFKYRTKNPSFMVTMRPSYIQTGCYLSLPRLFAERYFKESIDVKLELDDGRVWSVWCGVRWACLRRRTEFKGGWKTFAIDNELQEGDACVFEMVRRNPIVYFRVTFFRRPPN